MPYRSYRTYTPYRSYYLVQVIQIIEYSSRGKYPYKIRSEVLQRPSNHSDFEDIVRKNRNLKKYILDLESSSKGIKVLISLFFFLLGFQRGWGGALVGVRAEGAQFKDVTINTIAESTPSGFNETL